MTTPTVQQSYVRMAGSAQDDLTQLRCGRPSRRPTRWWRPAEAKAAVLVIVILAFNVAAIVLALMALSTDSGPVHQCPQAQPKVRQVVAPLCVPCEASWLEGEEGGRRGKEGEERGWRRYREEGGQEVCCPLSPLSLSSAVKQIYDTVLQEQQETVTAPSYSTLQIFYPEPTNTEETVLFTNHNKPSAHVTGVQPYNASRYSAADDKLQTVNDWPLRFEPYRSTTRGYVQRLTWGLVVPVTGLYRVHSMINFHFSSFSQDTRQRLPQDRRPFHVVHQLSRYRRATGVSAEVTQRNQTVSASHTDGLTSFLVTVQSLEVGDVISITLSHRAAMAMRDRWHSQGLFLLQ